MLIQLNYRTISHNNICTYEELEILFSIGTSLLIDTTQYIIHYSRKSKKTIKISDNGPLFMTSSNSSMKTQKDVLLSILKSYCKIR